MMDHRAGRDPDLYDVLQDRAARHPDRPALIHDAGRDRSRVHTYAELASRSRGFRAAFDRRGARGDLLPLYLSKSADCVAAMLGALGAGLVFCCLNKKLRLPQIESVLERGGPGLGLLDGAGAMTLGRGRSPGSPVEGLEWWLVREEPFLPPFEAAVAELGTAASIRDWPEGEPEDAGPGPLAGLSADRAGCCLFTSGSTGRPKGVLISSGDLSARAAAEADWFGLGGDDVLLNLLPFSFDVGLNQLLSGLHAGATLVMLDSWLPADILRASARWRVSGISAVPSNWQDMMNAGAVFATGGEHASLRYLTVSGGDLPPDRLSELPRTAPGVGIYKTYGQTEDFRTASLRPEEFAERPRSVGRAFGGVRLYVVDGKGDRCAPGVEGEVVHAGLGVMMGYLDGDDDKDKLRPNPFRGPDDPSPLAIFTGDRGVLDPDGYLTLRGRADSMWKIQGNRVYPNEITNQMLRVEGVVEAEVVAVEDAEGERRIHGFVVLADGCASTPMKLRRAFSTLLPSYMVPSGVDVVNAMPRTPNGKTDRIKLSAIATAGDEATER